MVKDKFPKEKIVCVEWEDACNNTGYYEEDNDYTFMTRTYGHLKRKNRKQIVIVSEVFDNGEERHVHAIPRKMVRSITKLSRSG